jgi:CheY-like chemotaxis protein
MHALIIEDEFMVATVIECVLRDCGFDSFDFAASKETAIAAAQSRRPDLITADVALETDCGIETVDTICKRPSIPVIFITASAARVRDQVPYAVLNKPFSEQTLTYAVSAALAR